MNTEVLSLAVKMDLDAIRTLVEFETKYSILDKSRQAECVMAKRIFVKLIDMKYDLSESSQNTDLITQPLLAEYLGYDDYNSVNHLLNNFEVFLRYSGPFKKHWETLKDLVVGNNYLKLKYFKNERLELMERIKEIDYQIKILTENENQIYQKTSEKNSE